MTTTESPASSPALHASGGSPEAVIFDCDGTLVDSERLATAAWEEVLHAHGYTLQPEDVAAMFGRPYSAIHAYLAGRAVLPDGPRLWAQFSEVMFRLLDAELVAFPDASSLASRLHAAGVPLAIASSSSRERLDRTLASSGLERLFPVVIAGDEISRGKPAPDIFLQAASRLAVPPARCLVIEDSPAGVTAGLAAGMRVVAVARAPEHLDSLSDAHLVVRTLDDEGVELATGLVGR